MTQFRKTAAFLSAKDESAIARVALFGCPYDGTSSFRPGARFGPSAIREASQALETYDPRLECDLAEVSFCDFGDVELSPGDKAGVLARIKTAAKDVLTAGTIPAALGGEHLITLPIVEAVYEKFPDLVLVHFDAHLDLKDKYLGDRLSHATVIRRVADLLQPSRILQVGTRSGTLTEFEFARKCRTFQENDPTDEIRQWVSSHPVYITVDLDVLDPAFFPGTGTPEPGGISYCKLEEWFLSLKGAKIVGWDVVELAPYWDPTQISSVMAAKVVRTLLCIAAIC